MVHLDHAERLGLDFQNRVARLDDLIFDSTP